MRRGSSRYRSPSEPSAASDRFLAVDRPARRTAQRSSRSRSHLRNEGLASLGWLRDEAEAASLEIALEARDRKSTRLNSSHTVISYAVFCLKKKKRQRAHATSE